jgi:50S ribosomal subunit-associated GTPase HflX
MAWPYSRHMVLGAGKVREIAERCQADHIGAVILVNALTDHQLLILEERCGCPIFSRVELEKPQS